MLQSFTTPKTNLDLRYKLIEPFGIFIQRNGVLSLQVNQLLERTINMLSELDARGQHLDAQIHYSFGRVEALAITFEHLNNRLQFLNDPLVRIRHVMSSLN
jgi:hypothetical protein